jgi:hypothetical protein
MAKAFILQIAIVGIIVVVPPACSAFGAVDSNSIESRDEFTAQINSKELRLSKGLKLSEAFETLGDPEDMDQGNYGLMLYGWGLESANGQSIIIEANLGKNIVTDWMVMKFEKGKVASTLAYSTAGGSRYRLSQDLKDMREVRKVGQPLCPNGLWCTEANSSEFDIREKYDVVGKIVFITLQNGGFKTFTTSENLADDLYLTITEPTGKKHISKLSKITDMNYAYPKIIDPGKNYW